MWREVSEWLNSKLNLFMWLRPLPVTVIFLTTIFICRLKKRKKYPLFKLTEYFVSPIWPCLLRKKFKITKGYELLQHVKIQCMH